jgi:hypothetical protein
MTGSSGVPGTPRPLGSIAGVSGILDHPHSRMMTAGIIFQTANNVIASEAKQSSFLCGNEGSWIGSSLRSSQ